jgi:drug/metabolite transporter (DMT)-like permease
MTPHKAKLILLVAIASISLSPIITRFATAPSLSISAYRLLFATLLTYMVGSKKIKKGISTLTIKQMVWILASGIALALHFWAWIESLSHTSVASSTLLVCTHPLIVLPLSALFFKEPIHTKKIIGITLTLVGTYYLSGIGQLSSLSTGLYGNLLAIIGAVFVGIYLLIGKHLRKNLDNDTYTFGVYFVATAFLWVTQIFSGIDLASFTLNDYVVFILLAIFPTLLGHTLFNKSLEALSATTVSLATLGEPILASIYAFFIFQEELTWMQIIAGILIMMGIYLGQSSRSIKPSKAIRTSP